jgi:orotidine-5'-phosphate decarboxylase
MVESRVILALDLTGEDEIMSMARDLGKDLFAIKVSWAQTMIHGAGIIRRLSEHSKVICDFKLADIPKTNAQIAGIAAEHGAWGIITQAFAGTDSVKAVVEASDKLKVFAVVSMTHGGSSQYIDGHIEDMVRDSLSAGVYGFVAPGNKPETLARIRSISGPKKIISPGIGAQGGDPLTALRNGADYVIVGRAIYQSHDPLSVLKRMNRTVHDAQME